MISHSASLSPHNEESKAANEDMLTDSERQKREKMETNTNEQQHSSPVKRDPSMKRARDEIPREYESEGDRPKAAPRIVCY
jgi:hypothetical protein